MDVDSAARASSARPSPIWRASAYRWSTASTTSSTEQAQIESWAALRIICVQATCRNGAGQSSAGRNRAESGSAIRSIDRSARAAACLTSTRLDADPHQQVRAGARAQLAVPFGQAGIGCARRDSRGGTRWSARTRPGSGWPRPPPVPATAGAAGGRCRSSAAGGRRAGGRGRTPRRGSASRRTSALASSGRAAPFPYPATRYSARTLEPSGACQRKAVRSTAEGTPRHTTACSNPASERIWGIWATWPNMSGR